MAGSEASASEMDGIDIRSGMATEVNRWDLIDRGPPDADRQLP